MAKNEEKKRGVGNAAQDAIRSGLTNEEALEAVRQEFPNSKVSPASINWYRNKMRQDKTSGIKTNRELKKAKKASDPLDFE